MAATLERLWALCHNHVRFKAALCEIERGRMIWKQRCGTRRTPTALPGPVVGQVWKRKLSITRKVCSSVLRGKKKRPSIHTPRTVWYRWAWETQQMGFGSETGTLTRPPQNVGDVQRLHGDLCVQDQGRWKPRVSDINEGRDSMRTMEPKAGEHEFHGIGKQEYLGLRLGLRR